jgi:hypothetical protein
MQYGPSASDRADCSRISIHSSALNSISPWSRQYSVSHWACTEPWGLILPGGANWLRTPDVACGEPDLLKATE